MPQALAMQAATPTAVPSFLREWAPVANANDAAKADKDKD